MNYNALTKDMVNAIVQNLKNHMDAPTIKDYADSVVPAG